jgi:hypothetical protein
MRNELFITENPLDIIRDIENFSGAYRTNSIHEKADFYRHEWEEDEDRESFEFDHFSFDK